MAERNQTVLIAVDGSPYAHHAFTWYMEHCYKESHRVVVAHCIQPPPIYESTDQKSYNDTLVKLQEACKQIQEDYDQVFKARGIEWSFLTSHETYPEAWIVEVAESENANLVVLGTRGFGTLRMTVLGTVADYVVQHVNCAVAMCHHEDLAKRKQSYAKDFFT